MKIHKIVKKIKPEFTVTAKLEDISVSEVVVKGNPDTMIILNTSQGKFSNFSFVWERQGIDADAIREGDYVKITYNVNYHAKTNQNYNNFVKVEVLPKDAVRSDKGPAENPKDEKDESTEALLEGIDL